MNKEALRNDYVTKGWTVQPVAEWRLVSAVNDKVKYDVNVVSPDNRFGTAQVIVSNDGEATEAAVAEGTWKENAVSFAQELRTFLNSKEAGAVYAIAVTDIKENDMVAEVKVYITSASAVTAKNYVVKKRNNIFDFKEIV